MIYLARKIALREPLLSRRYVKWPLLGSAALLMLAFIYWCFDFSEDAAPVQVSQRSGSVPAPHHPNKPGRSDASKSPNPKNKPKIATVDSLRLALESGGDLSVVESDDHLKELLYACVMKGSATSIWNQFAFEFRCGLEDASGHLMGFSANKRYFYDRVGGDAGRLSPEALYQDENGDPIFGVYNRAGALVGYMNVGVPEQRVLLDLKKKPVAYENCSMSYYVNPNGKEVVKFNPEAIENEQLDWLRIYRDCKIEMTPGDIEAEKERYEY